MYNKLKLFSICFLLLFFGCKQQANNKVCINNDVVGFKNNCLIPPKIEHYLNKNDWSIIDLNKYDKEFKSVLLSVLKYENNQFCPYSVSVDVTNDGKEDFAIIVRNKNKEDNNNFTLLIFNNYLNNFTPPHIILRKEIYNKGVIKSTIYSVKEHGLLSYLEKGNICGINVIKIRYYEKAGAVVYWDKENHQFIPSYYSNEVLCKKRNVLARENQDKERKKHIEQWQGSYSFSYKTIRSGGEDSGVVKFIINDNSKVYYDEIEESLEVVEVLKDTLKLKNKKGEEYKLYKTGGGKYKISGHPIYMLSPPNNDYSLTKEE